MAIDRVSKPKYIVGQSAAATFQGPWLNVEGLDNLSFHNSWTGNLTATVSLDGSNTEDVMDANTRQVTPSTRIAPATLGNAAAGNPAGAPGQSIATFTNVSTKWARLVVTVTGAGTLFSSAFMGKGI